MLRRPTSGGEALAPRRPPERRGAAGPRAAPAPFAHNGRAALALLPPAALLALSGGATLGCVGLVGVLLVYALDLQGSAEASLAAMLGTLLALAGGHLVSNLLAFGLSPLALALSAGAAAVALLLGAWGSLNFQSLLRECGAEMALLERALFAAAPFAAAPVLAWGALALDGPSRAPYHLGLALAALHAVCAAPVRASVRAAEGAGGAVGAPLCPRAAAALQSGACVLLPPLFQALQAGAGAAAALDALVAAAVPAAVLALRPAEQAFWWLAPAGARAGWRGVAASLCARAFAAGALGVFAVVRVLLGSLAHHVALRPPLDGAAATAAVGCALLPLVLGPLLPARGIGRLLSAGLLAGSAAAGAALFGVPPALCAVPALGALAGASALLGPSEPPAWLLAGAVLAAQATLCAFVSRALWPMRFDFDGFGSAPPMHFGLANSAVPTGGGGARGSALSLQQLLVLVLAAAFFALAAAAALLLARARLAAGGERAGGGGAPGGVAGAGLGGSGAGLPSGSPAVSARQLALSASASRAYALLSACHLPLLHCAEAVLLRSPPVGSLYPLPLVLATSAAGAAAVLAHARAGSPAPATARLPPSAGLLLCGYCGKLALLLPGVPEGRFALSAGPSLGLLLLALLHTPLLLEAGEATVLQVRAGALAAALAAYLARERALAPLLGALAGGRPPSGATTAALALALPALSAAAALRRHARGARGPRRQCVLVLLAGLLLWLLQPSLEPRLLAHSLAHTLLHPTAPFRPALPARAGRLGSGAESAPVAARLLLWPPWALWLLCVSAAGWVLLGPSAGAASRPRASLALGGALGALGGLYVAGAVGMPPDRLGYALLAGTAAAHGALLAGAHGAANSRRALRRLQALCLCLLAASVHLCGAHGGRSGAEHRATSGGQQSRVAALALGICLNVVIALSAKLQPSRAPAPGSWKGGAGSGAGFGGAASAQLRAQREAAAAPPGAAVGNVAAIVAAGLCARLHLGEMGGSAWGLPAIAPLLLLLRPEPALCGWLLPRRRYLPPCAALSAGCAALCLRDALLSGRAGRLGGAPHWPAPLPLLALCCTLPSQLSLLAALWAGPTPPIGRSGALLALCVLPLIWAHTAAQAVCAACGVAYGGAAMLLAHAREVEGLRKL